MVGIPDEPPPLPPSLMNHPFPHHHLIGLVLDHNNQHIIKVDGPFAAPSEHFTNYGTVMMVGAGIGLTPCASVISSIIRHRWHNSKPNPEIVHLYWVVRHSDVDSFQWLVHLLTELSFEYKKAREAKSIEAKVCPNDTHTLMMIMMMSILTSASLLCVLYIYIYSTP